MLWIVSNFCFFFLYVEGRKKSAIETKVLVVQDKM